MGRRRCAYSGCTATAEPSKRLCATHLAYFADRAKAHRDRVIPERRAAGLCIECGQPAAKDRARCEAHLAAIRDGKRRDPSLRREEYKARAAAGLCRIAGCGRAPVPGLLVCSVHREVEADLAAERYADHAARGLCRQCTALAAPGRVLCEDHLEYQREYARERARRRRNG